MPLRITVDLLTGTYEAGDTDDRKESEWPPHPARLFCALVSVARTDAERAALVWLERQQPPAVRAAAETSSSRSSTFVVANKVEAQGKSQTHPGRVNQLRVRARAFPRDPHVQFVWEQAGPDATTTRHLDELCRRVPYVGRSTGIATLAASVDEAVEVVEPTMTPGSIEESHTAVFEPCDQFDGEVSLRVPYMGFIDELDALHEQDRPAWQASRYLWYRIRRRQDQTDQAVVPEPSVYRDVVVLRFVGVRPDGRLSARLTQALRSRVLKAAGPDAPAVLHGHGADGRPHVAFLSLPNVASGPANKNADGHLLGLAVAVPDLPEPQRRAVLSAVLRLRRRATDDDGGAGTDLIDIDVEGLGLMALAYAPGLVRPWGATPQRWRQGSTRWVSATPMILDRYPKGSQTVEDIVRASVRQVGMPDPVDVDVSITPLMPGAVSMRPTDLPNKFRGRLYRHVSLTFDRPIAGPVMLGAGRYLGIGLLAPVNMGAPAGDETDGEGQTNGAIIEPDHEIAVQQVSS